MGEKHLLTVAGRFDKIRGVCKFVANGAQESGLDEAAVFHVELACDEACTNIIEHAYGAEDVGEIEISWHVADGRFTVTIRDKGGSFVPGDVPTPIGEVTDSGEAIPDVKVGGLGLHFMRTLMDEVHFVFDKENGNTLVMVKDIPA
jgi:serine/threonine-protein kinase RsbW